MAKLANARARWVTGVPHGDQAITVNRQSYFDSGGFPPVPLMEEYYLIRKLKPLGRIQILNSKVITSSRRYHRKGAAFSNLRNLFLIVLFYLGVSPNKLARFYK